MMKMEMLFARRRGDRGGLNFELRKQENLLRGLRDPARDTSYLSKFLRSYQGCLTFILMMAGLGQALAVEPQRLLFDSFSELQNGKCKNAALCEDGTLSKGPLVRKFADLSVGEIWDLVADGSGGLVAGTSPEGKLMRIDSAGKSSLIVKYPETHLYALTKNRKGEVFVGSSPDGKIYRIDSKGTSTVYFEPKQKYIWALAFDSKDQLFAATGTDGKIFKITGPNLGEVYFDSEETHIRSLAFDAKGALLAGSSNSGYLYRITGPNQGVVLAATGRSEVNRIAVTPTGVIYFAANSGINRSSRTTSTTTTVSNIGGNVTVRGVATESETPEASKSTPPAITPPSTAARSSSASVSAQVFRLDASNYPQPVWGTKDSIFALQAVGERIWVGAGNEGYLYRLDDHGYATRMGQVGADQPTVLTSLGGDAWVVGVNHPAGLYRIGETSREAAIYESEVINPKGFSRWGGLRAFGKGSFQLRTRSGNTPTPDRTWYSWAPVERDQVQSPAASYLQVEVQIIDGTVDRYELFVLPKNQPPKVEQVEFIAPGTSYQSFPNPPQPPSPKTIEQLIGAIGKPDPSSQSQRTNLRLQPIDGTGMRTAVWKATDPNQDNLLFRIASRREGENDWKSLAKDLELPVYSWDTTGWAEGRYTLQVEASDLPSNLPSEALTDLLVSRPFVVDHHAPTIQVQGRKNGLLTFTVTDNVGLISQAQFSKNGRDFLPARPSDGILDQLTEKFEILAAAGETIYLRAEDESGNVGGTVIHP